MTSAPPPPHGYQPPPPQGYPTQAFPPPFPPGPGAFVPPQPAPTKRRKWPWVLLAIVVLLVIAGIAGGNKKAANTSSPRVTSSLASVPPTISDAASSAVETTSAEAVVPAPVPPAPTKVLDLTGSGIKKSANFIVAADQWTIAYTFNCANFGGTGNFQIMVYNADGSLSDLAANELKASGKDSTVEHGAGKYYLEMNSECDWHVTVTG